MNDTMGLTPEVDAFVTAVRARFADLDADEREDRLDGLEADMSDLVAERGPEALGDPGAYAEELRAAAGLPELFARRKRRVPAIGLGEVLSDLHRFWDRSLDALPGSPRGFVETFQPVWWVVRGYVAWMLVQDIQGANKVFLTTPWLVLLGGLVVVSVQLGRGSWGLGVLREVSAGRLLVVGLNLAALALLPGALDRMVWQVAEERGSELYGNEWWEQSNPEVITYQGRQICTLFVVNPNGDRFPDLRVFDATSGRLLPMDNPDC